MKSFLLLLGLVAVFFIGRFIYFKPKYSTNQEVIDFTAIDKDGKTVKLSNFRGSYVLIDFWGSWCGPCRKENKEWVNFYSKYGTKIINHGKPLTFLHIGVEKNEASWKNAIEKDRLLWPHHLLQQQMFDSPIVKAFGVREIPTKYLISPEGRVLLVNPSFTDLEAFVEKGRI